MWLLPPYLPLPWKTPEQAPPSALSIGECRSNRVPGTGFQVKAVLDDILEKIPETFNMAEIMAKAAEKTPYVVVAFQECERMNILTNEMRRSLKELNLGLKVKTVGQPGQGQWLVKLAGPCLIPPPPQSGILCPPIQATEGGGYCLAVTSGGAREPCHAGNPGHTVRALPHPDLTTSFRVS